MPENPSAQRRTFAIIAHPDAGKTTLTEKLLLNGGAIQLAGEVKARGERRRVRSDWMAIERERGISVATSVMTFGHRDLTFNLLDTPGHEDFSEDTYRTLTAVDAAIMVLDAAKGIEPQTRKLFEVCRLRDIPIITLINKLDRNSQDSFALLDEIHDSLALDVSPLTWPIGSGQDFRGIYDIRHARLVLHNQPTAALDGASWDDPGIQANLDPRQLATLREEVELAEAACPPLDLDSFNAGHLTPVLFGSALRNVGVRELLDVIAELSPAPGAVKATTRLVEPDEAALTGFVFKIQANMDPNHRDRMAFFRICSGRLGRGMRLKLVRTGKMLTVQNPVFFFARDRELAEEAWPGDVVGLPNHGSLRIGDTLTEGEDLHFSGIPSFAPELIRRPRLEDPQQAKKLKHALEQLAEEGVMQLFKPIDGSSWLIGVVGPLQLDVLQGRLQSEYSVSVTFEPAAGQLARWVTGTEPAELERFMRQQRDRVAEDRDGAPVYLAPNAWHVRDTEQSWPELRFLTVREQHAL